MGKETDKYRIKTMGKWFGVEQRWGRGYSTIKMCATQKEADKVLAGLLKRDPAPEKKPTIGQRLKARIK